MKKNYFFQPMIVLAVIILFAGSVYMNAAVFGTHSAHAFKPTHADNQTHSQNLGGLMTSGSTYFLQGIANIHALLSHIEASEISGTDFQAMQEAVNRAIDNLVRAQSTYKQINRLASTAAYNPSVINRLVAFDYQRFQKNTRLIPAIFNNVQAYLGRGNVRGVYQQALLNIEDLIRRLVPTKKQVDSGQIPILSHMWRLNQKCTEYKLFGQYVAQVFLKSTPQTAPTRVPIKTKADIKE